VDRFKLVPHPITGKKKRSSGRCLFEGSDNIKQLSKKFFWILLIGVVVTFGLLTFLILQREKTIILTIFTEKSLQNANLIAENLISAMTEEKPELVLQKITAFNRTGEIRIGVAGPNGLPAFNTDVPIPEEIFSSQKEQFRKSGHEFILFKPLTNDDRCHRCHNAKDKTRGMLVIKTSMAEAETEVNTTAKRLLVFAFFLGLSSEIFLIIIVRKIILGPLEVLSKGSEILRAGKLDHRIDIRSKDEFGALGQMFNQMASSLEDSHKHLDRSVKQKTNELQVIAELSVEVFKGDLSLNKIIEQFLDAITNRMGYGFASFCLVDRETGLLSNEYKRGFEGGFCSIEIALASEHPFAKAITDARPSVKKYSEINAPETFGNITIIPVLSHQWKKCKDINHCEHKTCPAYDSADWRCWLVPDTLCSNPQSVAGKEKIYGCIYCAAFPVLGVLIAGGGPEISKSSLHSLEILASETAAAIENQRLIETKKEDINKLIKLHDISVESFQDIGYKLTKSIISPVTTFSNMDGAILWLTGKDGRLHLEDTSHIEKDLLPESLPLDEPLMGRALQEDWPIETLEMKNVACLRDVINHHCFLYAATVPLKFKDTTFGCLTLLKKKSFLMTNSEKAIIILFASQAAAAINTSRLYEQIREREHSYRTLSENLPGIVYRVHLRENNHTQYFNDMVRQMTGFSAEELTSGSICPIESLILPGDRERVAGDVERAVLHNSPFQVEYRLRSKEGETRYFLERGRPVVGTDGKPLYIDGVVFDITDSKKAEEEMNRLFLSLQGEKEFSEAIFTGAASAIMVLDKDSRLIKINRAGTDILGLDPGNIIGRRLTELFPETKDMLVIGNGLSREVVLSFPDGTLLPVGFNNSPLFDSAEGQKGIIVLFRDMSEIKRLQSELKKKEHFDTMGKVISGVAHEVRNPLFGISSIGQILERELDSPEHLTLIRAMLKETDRLKRLIEELLLYTRPSRLDIKEIDLAGLFAELNRYATTKKSELKISMDIQPGATILADRDKLIQVLLNLLSNAIDAARSMITVSAGNSNKTVKIEIGDDGTGISQEDLDRIFDPFFTTKKGGTGLGLPICRKLVEDHGGTIEVKSIMGKGTTVALTFKTG
jgi:PAS domain S-box-containing protein